MSGLNFVRLTNEFVSGPKPSDNTKINFKIKKNFVKLNYLPNVN